MIKNCIDESKKMKILALKQKKLIIKKFYDDKKIAKCQKMQKMKIL
jgi:hypothetical protein